MRILRRQAFVAVAVLALAISFAMPAPIARARITRSVLLVTVTTGANSRFTATTTIYSRKISFQADTANAATGYIGDSTLDPTSATTMKNTAQASLAAGAAYTPVMSRFEDMNGNQYRLSDFYAAGTTGDKFRLVYEVVN